MHLSELTLDKAKALVGTTFEVTLGGGATTTMTLDEVLPFDVTRQRRPPRQRRGLAREPFALYFLGPPTIIVPQGMYRFHSERESFEQLFIVPIGRDDEGTEYEAIFT